MSAATEAWRTAWRAVNTRGATAYVTIVTKDATTYRLATRACWLGADYYDGLLRPNGSVRSGSEFLDSTVSLASMTFGVTNAPCSQADGRPFSALVGEHDMMGASVELMIAPDEVDATNDGLTRFMGVVQTVNVRIESCDFTCLQRRDWNRTATPKVVTRADYPQALESTVGSPLPIVLGRILGPRMRQYGVAAYGQLNRVMEMIAGGRRSGAAVVVDAGQGPTVGATPAKVVVSSSTVAQLGADGSSWGPSLFMDSGGGALHAVSTPTSQVFNTTTDGAGFTLPDNATTAYYPVFPVDLWWGVSPGIDATVCNNPRAVLEPFNDLNVAYMNAATSQRTLSVKLGGTLEQGVPTTATAFVIYKTGQTVNGLTLNVSGIVGGSASAVLPSTNGAWSIGTLSGLAFASGTALWSFDNAVLGVGFFDPANPPYVGTGVCEVMVCGIAVEYKPTKQVIDTRKVVSDARTTRRRSDGETNVTNYSEATDVQNVTALRSKFFANVIGKTDDASGTFTGSANSIIERAPDIAAWLLNQVGGESTGKLASATAFGSFVTARSALKCRSTLNDMAFALSIGEAVDINTAVGWVADASASQVVLSEFTDRWEWHPWATGQATTYAMKVSKRDLLDPSEGVAVEFTPDSNVMSGVRIAYGWDAFTQQFAHEASASATNSNAGFDFRHLRDGTCKVTAGVNDKIDLVRASGTSALTIAAGDYTPTTLLSAIDTAFTGLVRSVAVGGIIVAGVNDRLPCSTDSGTGVQTGTAYLLPGTYTLEELAVEAQRALNVVRTGWFVTYNASLRKFSFYWSGGTWALTFAANTTQTCAAALGCDLTTAFTSINPKLSTYEVEPGRVSIAMDQEFNLPWRSGTNGLTGLKKSAWEPLGFDWVADATGIGFGMKRHMGHTPKSNLESTIAAADAQFGKRREVTRQVRAIYDTPTALELRDRLVGLMVKPRAVVTFASEVLADMRRADVFEFDADMDTLQPCPIPGSGGTWAGRRFRVLETVQKFGGSWHTEVVAIDITN